MTKRLVLLIALQMALLCTIIGKYHYIAATGTLITLKTAPIDPTDLFHGEYVTLNYEISQIDRDTVQTDLSEEMHNETVYVLLEEKNHPWYEAIGIYLKKPNSTSNQVILRAKVRYFEPKIDTIYLTYGIERYYIPENTGTEHEQLSLVDVRVSSLGEAIIEKMHN